MLAPSSHNSQPWKFAVAGNVISVAPEFGRALPQSDANHRQLYVSIGAAAENIVAAAEYYGYAVTAEVAEEDGGMAVRVRCDGRPLDPAARAGDHAALHASRRKTNRNPYESRMPDADFLAWATSLAGNGLQVHVVSAEPQKADIAGVVSDALLDAMDDTGFRRELSAYIRNNTTSQPLGMTMIGFGMPTPPSYLAPLIVRFVNVNRPSRKKDLADLTPAFIVLATEEDGPRQWIAAGRVFERMALEATKRGMATAPLAAGIQIGQHYRRLQTLLATAARPQVFFRIGYAVEGKEPPHSPRLTASEVTTVA